MTSNRPYVPPLTDAEALVECRRLAGAQFWEVAVSALESLAAAGGLGAADLERRALLERL